MRGKEKEKRQRKGKIKEKGKEKRKRKRKRNRKKKERKRGRKEKGYLESLLQCYPKWIFEEDSTPSRVATPPNQTSCGVVHATQPNGAQVQ